MRVLCVLVVCFLGLSWAMPQRYYAVPSQVDDDDDADVEDAPYDNDDASFDDMFTFPTGGPGGPPGNKFLDSPRQARTDNQLVSYPGTYYFSYDSDPTTLYPGNPLEDGFMESEDESPQYARQLARKEEESKPTKDEQEDEQEDEEEEEDEDEDDDPGSDSEPDYAVPDMNKLFPNPEGRPRGPGDYNAYLKHSSQKQQPQQGSAGPPSRRYRYVEPEYYNEINALTDQYDTVVIEADAERSRRIESQAPAEQEDEEEDEEVDDAEDEGDADDDVDFSVPSYDTLFPNPDNKQVANSNLFGGMKNTWNNAPRPPGGRYARVIRLFQSPLHHDTYNPDYVIDPTIAMNRRNERLRYRYSSPHWRQQNIKTPYNYKPILYQRGHWGNPREHDYNPISGHHYLGGIYNGNTYY